MNGNVFELSGEGGTKPNQFTETMTALYRYASQELDCVEDLDPLFTSPPFEPNIPKPPMQPPLIDNPAGSGPKIRATRDYFEYHDWKNECDNYGVRKKELIKNNIHLFAVILEQCSTSVENKLKGSPGYLDANRTHNCYWLILTLKNICHNFEHHKYKFNSLIKSALHIGFCMSQVGICLAQVDPHFPDGIPTHFILLDSDSTISIFNNADFLTDIHDVSEPLYLETNGGGQQLSTQMGTLPGFGLVWYNPASIANVLSLAEVRLIRRVTMDSAQAAAFIVYRPDGKSPLVFSEHASGLYLLDASVPTPDHAIVDPVPQPTLASDRLVVGHSYLQTVAANKAQFTARQIAGADAARHLYRLLGRPGHTRFLSAIRNNHIVNCPVTIDDAIRAETIYGKDVAFLKGKTTDSAPTPHIVDFLPTALPPDILANHGRATLCFDIFYVHGLAFCLSVSRSIRYFCCHFIPDRSKSTLGACLSSDLATYQARGFTPVAIHADSEFAVCRPLFPGIQFSICAVDAHVPEVERAIRTVKETVRATIHGMPFSRLPRVLVKELIASAVAQTNMFPHPDGISDTLSPSSIVTGAPKPDFHCFPLEFGQYVQVYDGTSNDTRSRTLSAIATTPTNNSSGDHFFLSLATGHRIHRRSWTVLPISDLVISRVEAIASQESMPWIDDAPMLHEYDPDALVDAAEYDRDYVPPATAPPPDHHLTTNAYTDTSDDDASSADDDIGHHPAFDDVPLTPVAPVLPPVAFIPTAPVVERLDNSRQEEYTNGK